MAREYRTYQNAMGGSAQRVLVVDQGLRAYMLRVYNYMAAGLAFTGLVAFFTANTPALMNAIFGTPLAWVVILAPLGLVFFLSARINAIQASTAQLLFWVYAATLGLSLATLFVAYTGESITRVFFISASMFAAMSLYGYTTKQDLSVFGSFLFMGVIGVAIASVVNIFMQSSALDFAVSIIGTLVFTGLTAYDTQMIKSMYYAGDTSETATKKAVMGALSLYIDFLNIFLMLLRLMGDRR